MVVGPPPLRVFFFGSPPFPPSPFFRTSSFRPSSKKVYDLPDISFDRKSRMKIQTSPQEPGKRGKGAIKVLFNFLFLFLCIKKFAFCFPSAVAFGSMAFFQKNDECFFVFCVDEGHTLQILAILRPRYTNEALNKGKSFVAFTIGARYTMVMHVGGGKI